MLQVLLWCSAGDENVINIAKTEVQTMEHLIDEPLKGLGGVSQPEGHSLERK